MHEGHRPRGPAVKALLLFALLGLPPAAQAQQEDLGEARLGLISPGGFLLFFDSVGPMSFITLTPKDLPKDAVLAGDVQGEGCQHSLSIPLGSPLSQSKQTISGAAGRGGFEKALQKIRERSPGLRGIYDVKVDDRITSILGFYRRLCIEITARGFR